MSVILSSVARGRPGAFIRPVRRELAMSLGLSCAAALSNFALLFLSGWLLAGAAAAGLGGIAARNAFNMLLPATGVRFFATIRILARYGERVATHGAALRLVGQARRWTFEKLALQSSEISSGSRDGERLQHFVSDTDMVGQMWVEAILPFATAGLCGMVFVGLTAAFVPEAGLELAYGLAVAGIFIPFISGRLTTGLEADLAATRERMHVELVEAVQASEELKFLRAVPAVTEALSVRQENLNRSRHSLENIEAGSTAAVSVLAMLTALTVLFSASARHDSGALSAACLVMLTLGAIAAFDVVMPLPAARQMFRRTGLAVRRLQTLDADIVDESEKHVAGNGFMEPDNVSGLALLDAGLRYPSGKDWIFRHASLVIRPGERVAVIGPSGAGKTSLIRLLAGVCPLTEGEILLGGCKVASLSEGRRAALIGVAAQDFHLFQGTVRRNFLIACPDATEAEMWDLLETVKLAELLHAEGAGLDTLIGERGMRLSGGQARRLSLARTLLRRPRWLVLDEPTEELDAATEASLLEALLSRLSAETTLVCVTHRIAPMRFMDRVIAIGGGRIVENPDLHGRSA